MRTSASSHAEEDKQRREEAEVRNQAETLVYQTEKFVKDNDDKLPSGVKDKVNVAIKEAQESLNGTDIAVIKAAMEKLATESQAMGSAMYAQTGAQAGGDTGAGAGEPGGEQATPGAEDVVDAEIVDEDGKK